MLEMKDGFAPPPDERIVPPVAWLIWNIVVFLSAESFSFGIAIPIAWPPCLEVLAVYPVRTDLRPAVYFPGGESITY